MSGKLLRQIIRILKRYQCEQPERFDEYDEAIRYIRLVCIPKFQSVGRDVGVTERM